MTKQLAKDWVAKIYKDYGLGATVVERNNQHAVVINDKWLYTQTDIIKLLRKHIDGKNTMKKNPAYGYGTHDYEDNPMKQDDIARALHTINYTFNTVDKHVTVGGEGGQYHVYVTDLRTDDIIRTWGPISKDAATYILLGILETIKIVRYE